MSEAPLSNRPAPRTTAAVEAELRRQIRADMTQARADADGELNDESLASIIAHAIGMAVGWHLDSPEHTRNATVSSRTWRPAGGPRGGRPPDNEERSFEDRSPRQFDDRRRGPPPPQDRGPSQDRGSFRDRSPYPDRPPRDFDDRGSPPRRGPRDDDRDFPPRRGPQGRPSGFGPRSSGGRPPNRGGSGGGYGPRRQPPRSR
ncbi:MAG: hypothetical protein ACR2IK_11465 [Chloroflexota bacterium]